MSFVVNLRNRDRINLPQAAPLASLILGEGTTLDPAERRRRMAALDRRMRAFAQTN